MRSREAADTSTAGSRPAAACSPASSWRGSALADLARGRRSCPARSAAGRAPLVQVVTDHPVRACLASQYAGWAIKEGKYFAMGSGPMRAAAGHRGDLRRDRLSRDGRARSSACSRRASRRRRRSSPRSPRPAGSSRRAVTLLVAPDGQPGRRRADRGPIGRDGPAQAGRAQVRPVADRLGPRHGPPAAGRRQRPRRDRPDQRRDPLRRPGDPRASPATTPASSRSGPRSRRRPRAITASRSRRSSPGTTTTSTRSILTCSARPRSSSRTSRRARSMPSDGRARRAGRSFAREPVGTRTVSEAYEDRWSPWFPASAGMSPTSSARRAGSA